ncbi:GAF domain-containing protein [Haloarculaceae archaeon H-GB11]|nr:GAF domain-containing protein [Haloarculaceae archaeon H-GB11]
MEERPHVLVVGDEGSTATALQDASDRLTATEVATVDADVGDRVSCVVYDVDDLAELLDSTEQRQERGTHVVAFVDDSDAETTKRALDGPVDAVVQAGGDESVVVLAHRIEQLVGERSEAGRREERVVASDGLGGPVPVCETRPLDRITDGIVAVDDEWRYTYVNGSAEEILGVESSAVLGEPIWSGPDVALGPTFEAETRQAMETQTARSYEEYHGALDRWLQITIYPDSDGLTVYARDVTEQKMAKTGLERNEQALRRLQSLAASGDLGVDAKIERALEIGCARLDLPVGYLTRVDDRTLTVVVSRGDHEQLQPESKASLSETYCREAIEADGLLAVTDAEASGWDDDPAYERFGLGCYLGGTVDVYGELYGTFCFADTEARTESFTAAEETFIELLTEWVSHELERDEREHELKRYEAMLESIDDGVYELGDDGIIRFVNQAMCELSGYDRSELVGEHYSKVVGGETVARAEEAVANALSTGRDGETFTLTVQPKGRRPVEAEVNMTILRSDDGEYNGTVGVVRDITEQRAYRDRLSELLSASRTLMQARTREEVAEMVVTAAKNVLGFDLNVVRLYDADAQELVPVAATSETEGTLGDRPRYGLHEAPPGEVFASGESVVYEDAGEIDDEYDRSPLRSAMYFPMGVHGTISLGTTSGGRTGDIDEQLAALLATSAAAACNRAKREEDIREAHERIDALVDHINGLIEDTIEVLVNATTREEIESKVCDELLNTKTYDCAWIGRPDLSSETLQVSQLAGCEQPAEEFEFTITGESTDPCVRAFVEGETQVVEDLARVPDGSMHRRAHEEGMTGLLAIPLTYKETVYGVLTVYAASAKAFEDREQVVLGALGRAIGNAINAVERGRILSTDRVVELEVTVRDDDLLFSRLSAATDCTLESAGTLQQSDGTLDLYVTSEDADAETFLDVARDDPAVSEAACIVDHEGETLFELVAEETLVTTLAERGAMPLGVEERPERRVSPSRSPTSPRPARCSTS